MMANRTHNRRQGFTLIEVLIVLVILLVGILALLQIFPVGFSTIESSQNRSTASVLTEGEVERQKLRTANLPDVIAGWDGGMATADYSSSSLLPDRYGSLYLPESATTPRLVLGERVKIQASGGSQLPFYVLLFAPIEPLSAGTPVVVYSTAYRSVSTKAELGTAGPDRYRYYLNLDTGEIWFDQADYPRTFKLDYSYLDRSAAGEVVVRSRVDESLTVPASQGGPEHVYTLGAVTSGHANEDAGFQKVMEGSARVFQQFTLDGAPPTQSGHFYLPAAASTTGVIVFAAADAGRDVRIDYLVRDWSIIREQKTADDQGRIKLAVGYLKDADYLNPPRQTAAMPVGTDGAGDPRYVVAIDMGTGTGTFGDTQTAMWPEVNQIAPDGNFRVDYRHGLLEMPAGSARRTFTVYYRAQGDWTLQTQKAAIYYQDSGVSGLGTYQQYTRVALGTDSGNAARLDGLEFERSEAGKSVMVDYTFLRAGVSRRVVGEIHLIGGEDGDYPYRIVLNRFNPRKDPQYADATLVRVDAVRGASVGVRALWSGPGKVKLDDGSTLTEVWREVTLSNFLNPR
jgi:prepilin-type N-terminal cleavage/methylation domain-containing protein